MSAAARVVDPARAAAAVLAWRAAGARVALARGDFDLLTVGHVRQLAAARARAERLVVAVRDDRDAGSGVPGRPVLPVRDRAALVAALRGVDLVVVLGAGDAAPPSDLAIEVAGAGDPVARVRAAGRGAP